MAIIRLSVIEQNKPKLNIGVIKHKAETMWFHYAKNVKIIHRQIVKKGFFFFFSLYTGKEMEKVRLSVRRKFWTVKVIRQQHCLQT